LAFDCAGEGDGAAALAARDRSGGGMAVAV